MNLLIDHIDNISLKFTSAFWNVKATRFFLKSLIIYALLKILLLWPIANEVLEGQRLVVPRSIIGKVLLWPSQLAAYDIGLFYGLVFGVLLIFLLQKPNYFFQAIFSWLILNLFRVNYALSINGSDYVLLMLSIWSIPLAARPVIQNDLLKTIQIAVHNVFVVFVQLQVVFVYLMSGWDKIVSPVWRSGEAFSYIQHIDTMLNPAFYNLLESESLNFMYSWLTIVFELAFAILVWFNRTRIFILGIGLIFHLIIWIMLSLPDFALIMIFSYLIFLNDDDYRWISSKLKPKLL